MLLTKLFTLKPSGVHKNNTTLDWDFHDSKPLFTFDANLWEKKPNTSQWPERCPVPTIGRLKWMACFWKAIQNSTVSHKYTIIFQTHISVTVHDLDTQWVVKCWVLSSILGTKCVNNWHVFDVWHQLSTICGHFCE